MLIWLNDSVEVADFCFYNECLLAFWHFTSVMPLYFAKEAVGYFGSVLSYLALVEDSIGVK